MKFYNTLESLCRNPPPYSDPFLVQWEIPHPDGEQTRKYIAFSNISEYITLFNRGSYTTCHELFLPPSYNTDDDFVGHPAFDIDIAEEGKDRTSLLSALPPTWEADLAADIGTVLKAQYPGRDFSLDPVWMSSTTTSKLSKHLLLRGITFSMWRSQMKVLMSSLKSLPSRRSTQQVMDALDDGILRKCGSLRLPLNSKRPKEEVYMEDGEQHVRYHRYPLRFDNPTFTFLDGLVMIHNENMYTLDKSTFLMPTSLSSEYQMHYVPPKTQYREEEVPTDDLEHAFFSLDKGFSTGLIPSKASGKILQLQRISPGKCPISGRIHESENAYLVQKDDLIYFGCHRGCSLSYGGKEYKTIDVTPCGGIEHQKRQVNSMTLRQEKERDLL